MPFLDHEFVELAMGIPTGAEDSERRRSSTSSRRPSAASSPTSSSTGRSRDSACRSTSGAELDLAPLRSDVAGFNAATPTFSIRPPCPEFWTRVMGPVPGSSITLRCGGRST